MWDCAQVDFDREGRFPSIFVSWSWLVTSKQLQQAMAVERARRLSLLQWLLRLGCAEWLTGEMDIARRSWCCAFGAAARGNSFHSRGW